MNHVKNIFLAFLCVGLSTACFAQNYEKRFNPASVPADLKKNGQVLIVLSSFDEEKDQDRIQQLNTVFKNIYKGKFVLVNHGGHDFSGYDDKTIYKYMVTVSPVRDGPHLWFTAGISDRAKEKLTYITCGINAPQKSFEEFITFYAQKLSEAAE